MRLPERYKSLREIITNKVKRLTEGGKKTGYLPNRKSFMLCRMSSLKYIQVTGLELLDEMAQANLPY